MSRPRASHAFFAALGLLCAGLAAVHPRFFASLVYERAAVLQGEVWRLLTVHVVHASGMHVAWNLLGLAVVWIAFGPRLSGRGWLGVGAASALGSALGVLLFHSEVRAMAGLSGLLHGLLAAGAVASIRSRNSLGWLFLAIVAAKVAWEQIEGTSAAAASLGGSIAFQSHLYGAVTGLLAGALIPRADGGRGTPPDPPPSRGGSGDEEGARRPGA